MIKYQDEFEDFYRKHYPIDESHLVESSHSGNYFYTDTQIMYKLWLENKLLKINLESYKYYEED